MCCCPVSCDLAVGCHMTPAYSNVDEGIVKVSKALLSTKSILTGNYLFFNINVTELNFTLNLMTSTNFIHKSNFGSETHNNGKSHVAEFVWPVQVSQALVS